MSEFLLVHGAFHGAWCWHKVVAELDSRGHRARAVDLPSHGDDRTPPEQASLQGYVRAIADAVTDPVVLVAHSMAGVPAAVAADQFPDKIRRVIYVAAYVPIHDESVVDLRAAAPRYDFGRAVRVDPLGPVAVLDWARAEPLLFDQCSPEDRELARVRVRPEPTEPLAQPAGLGRRPTRVTSRYVQCQRDRVIVPEYQTTMAQRSVSTPAYRLDAGHSPFFSHPAELADVLIQAAR